MKQAIFVLLGLLIVLALAQSVYALPVASGTECVYGFSQNNNLLIYNTASQAFVQNLQLGGGINNIALNPSGTYLFALQNNGQVFIYDTLTYTFKSSISLPSGYNPYSMVFSSTGSIAYI